LAGKRRSHLRPRLESEGYRDRSETRFCPEEAPGLPRRPVDDSTVEIERQIDRVLGVPDDDLDIAAIQIDPFDVVGVPVREIDLASGRVQSNADRTHQIARHDRFER